MGFEMVVDETPRKTEAELIEECQRGDTEAFRAIFERHRDKVYSVALRYCGDATLAHDITQDTFVKLFSAIGSFRGASKFDSWLYRLVVNSCFDHKRRSRRLLPLVGEMLGLLRNRDESALDSVMRLERNTEVQSAVAGLPAEQRMVIVLRYTQGLSYDEIAEILSCSAGTVASRLSRGHKTLERRLARLAPAQKELGNHV
jgi:RNA polymerase sigma-70 factor (ECF subfamily)